jgi:hypothetical protein
MATLQSKLDNPAKVGDVVKLSPLFTDKDTVYKVESLTYENGLLSGYLLYDEATDTRTHCSYYEILIK